MALSQRKIFCSDNVLFAMMQALFWAGFGMLVVYLTGYLEGAGYSSWRIGVVRASGAVGAVSGAAVWSTLADTHKKIGTLMCIAVLCGIALFPLFVVIDGAFVPMILVFTTVAFFLFPMPTLIDSWTTQIAHLNSSVSYGLTRSMGSFGFAMSVIIAGRIFDARGIGLLFPGYAIVLACLVPVILVQRHFAQERLQLVHHDRGKAGTGRTGGFLNRPFVVFLAICAVLLPCFTATLIFMPLMMAEIGGTHRHVGAAFSLMAFSEIPLMICAAILLARFRDTSVIAFSLLFFFLRIFGFVIAQNPATLIAVQVFQGGSIALFLPAAISLCSRVVRRSYRTRALALFGFMLFGVSDISASLLGGWLALRFGVRMMYAIASGVMLVPIISYWWLFVVRPRMRMRACARIRA